MQYIFPLYIVTGVAVLISLIVNRKKTLQAGKIAAKRFVTILPAFLLMLIMVSIVLFLIPNEAISSYLVSGNRFSSVFWASLIGSVTLMPGFIAYPLSAILLQEGVQYMVLSAFTTTLMMVGVLTYPVERDYFGRRVTIIRNAISYLIALVVAIATGFFFGELF